LFAPLLFGDGPGRLATRVALQNNYTTKVTLVARVRMIASPSSLNRCATLNHSFAPLLLGDGSGLSAANVALQNKYVAKVTLNFLLHDGSGYLATHVALQNNYMVKVTLVTRGRIIASPSSLSCSDTLNQSFAPLLLGDGSGRLETYKTLQNNQIAKVPLEVRVCIIASP
jgi:hypothetical protein